MANDSIYQLSHTCVCISEQCSPWLSPHRCLFICQCHRTSKVCFLSFCTLSLPTSSNDPYIAFGCHSSVICNILSLFNLVVNGKIIKCPISGHLSSVWGHSVYFAKFPILRFLIGYCSHSFHPMSTKLYGKHGDRGGGGGGANPLKNL